MPPRASVLSCRERDGDKDRADQSSRWETSGAVQGWPQLCPCLTSVACVRQGGRRLLNVRESGGETFPSASRCDSAMQLVPVSARWCRIGNTARCRNVIAKNAWLWLWWVLWGFFVQLSLGWGFGHSLRDLNALVIYKDQIYKGCINVWAGNEWHTLFLLNFSEN